MYLLNIHKRLKQQIKNKIEENTSYLVFLYYIDIFVLGTVFYTIPRLFSVMPNRATPL